MRTISSSVVVRGGMSTTTSPSGRSSTPRSTAPAQTRRPQRSPGPGGASSTPTMRPRWRTSATPRRGAMRSARRRASWPARARTLASTSHASISRRCSEGHRGGQGVAAVGVAVEEGLRPEVRAEERVEDLARGHGGRHGEIAAGDPLARGRAGRAGGRTARRRRGCRSGRSRSPPRRRPGARRASRQASPSARTSAGSAHSMPDAPCTSGSIPPRPARRRGRRRRRRPWSAQPGIGVARGAHDREAQRVEHGAEHAAVAERERADGVAVVGVAEGEEPRAPLDAPVDPVLEGDLQRLLDGDRPVGGEQEVGRVDRHHARPGPRPARPRPCCRCRAWWCGRPCRPGRPARRRARGPGARAC